MMIKQLKGVKTMFAQTGFYKPPITVIVTLDTDLPDILEAIWDSEGLMGQHCGDSEYTAT